MRTAIPSFPINSRYLAMLPGIVGMGACLKVLLMKRLSLVLLVCYSLMLIRPALPAFIDMLDHTFRERQHLMLVHEEHGKFHIHYEQQKVSHDTEKGKPCGTSGKYDIGDYLHEMRIVTEQRLLFAGEEIYFGFYHSFCPDSFLPKTYIPPKV